MKTTVVASAAVVLFFSAPGFSEPLPAELIAAACPAEWRDQSNRYHGSRLDLSADWLPYIAPGGRDLRPGSGLGHVNISGAMWETYRRRYGLPPDRSTFERWEAPTNGEHSYGVRNELLRAYEEGRITRPTVRDWVDYQATWRCSGPRIGADLRSESDKGISGPQLVELDVSSTYCVSGVRGGGPPGVWSVDGDVVRGRGSCMSREWIRPGEHEVEFRKGSDRRSLKVLVLGLDPGETPEESDPLPEPPADPPNDPGETDVCRTARAAANLVGELVEEACR